MVQRPSGSVVSRRALKFLNETDVIIEEVLPAYAGKTARPLECSVFNYSRLPAAAALASIPRCPKFSGHLYLTRFDSRRTFTPRHVAKLEPDSPGRGPT